MKLELKIKFRYSSLRCTRNAVMYSWSHTFSTTFSTPFLSSTAMFLISEALLLMKLFESCWSDMLSCSRDKGYVQAINSLRMTSVNSSCWGRELIESSNQVYLVKEVYFLLVRLSGEVKVNNKACG